MVASSNLIWTPLTHPSMVALSVWLAATEGPSLGTSQSTLRRSARSGPEVLMCNSAPATTLLDLRAESTNAPFGTTREVDIMSVHFSVRDSRQTTSNRRAIAG